MSAPVRWRALSRAQSRQVDIDADQHYGLSGLVLMENAGSAAAQWIHQHYPAGKVSIVCGKGNNAGDGYVIARHLQTAHCYWPSQQVADGSPLRRWDVQIVSVSPLDDLTGDAATNCRIAQAAGISIGVVDDSKELQRAIGEPDVIIDCLLGTGASGPPRGLFAAAIDAINRSRAVRIAIDLPSGLDADTGQANEPTVVAEVTLTMVTGKLGFAATADQIANPVGRVVPLPIGLPLSMLRGLMAENDQTSRAKRD